MPDDDFFANFTHIVIVALVNITLNIFNGNDVPAELAFNRVWNLPLGESEGNIVKFFDQTGIAADKLTVLVDFYQPAVVLGALVAAELLGGISKADFPAVDFPLDVLRPIFIA